MYGTYDDDQMCRGRRVEIDDECGHVCGPNRCNYPKDHLGSHAERRVVEEICAAWEEED